MIIRRIAQGVKDQDWFVVMIEVMIVVVGIFIGLQVDDWNEDRKEAKLEQVYLEKLLADIDRSLELQQFEIDRAKRELIQIQNVLDGLAFDVLPEEFREKFEIGLMTTGVTRSPRLVTGTIKELMSSARLILIKDDKIRFSLISLIDEFDRDIITLQKVDSRYDGYKTRYSDYVLRRLYNPKQLPNVVYDFQALKDDGQFENTVQNLRQLLALYLGFHESVYDETKAFRAILTGEEQSPIEKSSS